MTLDKLWRSCLAKSILGTDYVNGGVRKPALFRSILFCLQRHGGRSGGRIDSKLSLGCVYTKVPARPDTATRSHFVLLRGTKGDVCFEQGTFCFCVIPQPTHKFCFGAVVLFQSRLENGKIK